MKGNNKPTGLRNNQWETSKMGQKGRGGRTGKYKQISQRRIILMGINVAIKKQEAPKAKQHGNYDIEELR